jgi:hypothetical protein
MRMGGRHAGKLLPVQQDAPGRRLHEPGDGAQKRGLARPRAAEQHEQLAVRDRQVEAVQRRYTAVADGKS